MTKLTRSLTDEDRKAIQEMTNELAKFITEHEAHGSWEQVGRCVYCSCGVRLYSGTVPPDMKPKSELCSCRKYRTSDPKRMAKHKETCRDETS